LIKIEIKLIDISKRKQKYDVVYYKCGYSGEGGGGSFSDDNIDIVRNAISLSIHQIEIRSAGLIDSIQIIYNVNGTIKKGEKHGGNGGSLHRFELIEGEYIVGISGRYGGKIDSLIIHTNKRSSPRYGGKSGYSEYAYFAPPCAEIIGFVGRSGWYLDAIGVIMKNKDIDQY